MKEVGRGVRKKQKERREKRKKNVTLKIYIQNNRTEERV